MHSCIVRENGRTSNDVLVLGLSAASDIIVACLLFGAGVLCCERLLTAGLRRSSGCAGWCAAGKLKKLALGIRCCIAVGAVLQK